MTAWNFMSYESKDNLLEAIRRESAGMFALAEDPGRGRRRPAPATGRCVTCSGTSSTPRRPTSSASTPRAVTVKVRRWCR